MLKKRIKNIRPCPLWGGRRCVKINKNNYNLFLKMDNAKKEYFVGLQYSQDM
eukprot:SAG11_NODE_44391_length_155_cov_611.946429_1_plen_51_part_11